MDEQDISMLLPSNQPSVSVYGHSTNARTDLPSIMSTLNAAQSELKSKLEEISVCYGD